MRDRLRKYRILIDGSRVGTIGPGEVVDFPLAPGPHRLKIRIDWCASPEVETELADGEVVDFECSPAGPVLVHVLRAVVTPGHYLNLRRSTPAG